MWLPPVGGCVCVSVWARLSRAYYGRVCENSSSDFPLHFGKIVEKLQCSVATTRDIISRARWPEQQQQLVRVDSRWKLTDYRTGRDRGPGQQEGHRFFGPSDIRGEVAARRRRRRRRSTSSPSKCALRLSVCVRAASKWKIMSRHEGKERGLIIFVLFSPVSNSSSSGDELILSVLCSHCNSLLCEAKRQPIRIVGTIIADDTPPSVRGRSLSYLGEKRGADMPRHTTQSMRWVGNRSLSAKISTK